MSDTLKDKITAELREKITEEVTQSYIKETPSEHIRRGSVLNDGWWWPFKNDAWIMGGIHGIRRFHLAMGSLPPDDLIWAKGRPRMLGRELLGLSAFNYSLIGAPTSWSKKPEQPEGIRTPVTTGMREFIGYVFAPISAKDAQEATFTSYYTELAKVKSINDIKDSILKDEVAFGAYDFSEI